MSYVEVERQLCGTGSLCHLDVSSRDSTRGIRLAWQVPVPTEPSHPPRYFILDLLRIELGFLKKKKKFVGKAGEAGRRYRAAMVY